MTTSQLHRKHNFNIATTDSSHSSSPASLLSSISDSNRCTEHLTSRITSFLTSARNPRPSAGKRVRRIQSRNAPKLQTLSDASKATSNGTADPTSETKEREIQGFLLPALIQCSKTLGTISPSNTASLLTDHITALENIASGCLDAAARVSAPALNLLDIAKSSSNIITRLVELKRWDGAMTIISALFRAITKAKKAPAPDGCLHSKKLPLLQGLLSMSQSQFVPSIDFSDSSSCIVVITCVYNLLRCWFGKVVPEAISVCGTHC